ncbi:NAD(P)-dependent alcohol dehydrogenase [Arthrobacter sp. ISL-30]|uniref:NAD(P)-dependent alcohol dehydrogenase n=1 Tax=Arthrobacter sp. ISL-30 TaxID=2819109 RepID=UPI001BE5122F|nr:NAD(P)-dependent alcohol dehydrogenase [Arthrobacter sp. ISL-30]MBT2514872.1 NAD(P)-dependent alcohol dehydrogenase [Arthrobacter sp. ISL-30]
MKAITQHMYGEADVLSLEDLETPAVGDDEVLVRVKAAGVDAGVWHLMAGKPYLLRLFGGGFRRPKVRLRGRELAGEVTAVGRKVTLFRPGDEVFGISLKGSFAEYAVAGEDRLETKPANLTFEEAAAVPVSGAAALHALRDSGHVQEGQSVLIIGAGGGVGSFAMQIATALGAKVTAVCSAGKADFVKSLGAENVIDYRREDFSLGDVRYDLILDIAGNSALPRLRRVLAPEGTLVFVGGEGGGPIFGGLGRPLRALVLSLFTRQKLRSLVSAERAEDLRDLRAFIEAGKIRPVVDTVYPLADAPAAVARWKAGRVRGKLVITP